MRKDIVLRSRKIRAGCAALALTLAPLASGCSASYGAESQAPYTPADGVWTDSGDLQLRNIVVVSDAEGRGTLVGTLLNTGGRDDNLTDIRVRGGESLLGTDPIVLPADEVVQLGTDTHFGTAVPVAVEGEPVRAGKVVRLTFVFDQTPSVSADVFVVAQEGPYATVPGPTELQPAAE